MANIVAITGMQNVLANLKARTTAMGLGFAKGAKVAGLRLQRESQKLVPVDTGNLKNSAFTRSSGIGFGTVVHVGYTEPYGLYVHENVEMKLKGQLRGPAKGQTGYHGRFWDPQGRGQAKFLEEPARRLAPELRAIIQAFMRIT